MESARKRLKLVGNHRHEIAALEKSGKPTDTLQLHAPVSGYVIQKNIDPAQMVRPGKTLYRVADFNTVWINADIYEYELPYVKVGQKVTVTALRISGTRLRRQGRLHLPVFGKQDPHHNSPAGDGQREGTFQTQQLRQRGNQGGIVGQRLLMPDDGGVRHRALSQYVFVEATEGHFVPARGLSWVPQSAISSS